MPLPSPSGVWKLARFVIREAAYAIPAGVVWLEDQLAYNESASGLGWVRAVCVCQRNTPAGTSEDFAQIKFDFVNITGGAIDDSWTSADLNTLDAAIQAFLTSYKGYMWSTHSWKQIRYYPMHYNEPPDPNKPFQDSGTPVRVSTINITGTSSDPVPYQVALSVTLKTAWAGHWGRVYLPGPSGGAGFLDSMGRFDQTSIQGIASSCATMIDDLGDAGFLCVVPVTQLNKAPFHALLGVTSVQVDDVPDVQRRRRAKQAKLRMIGVPS